MVKETADPLVENGSPVTVVSEPFKPKEAIGTVDVTFTIDTRDLIGKELVAFETAYKLEGYKKGDDITKVKKIKIAEHKDINDEGQTVKITEPETPNKVDSPKTGDNNMLKFFAAVMVIAALGITVLAGKDAQRKIKQRREDREMFR